MDKIMLTYEKFLTRQKKYKDTSKAIQIYIDMDTRAASIISDMIVDKLRSIYGEEIKNLEKGSAHDKRDALVPNSRDLVSESILQFDINEFGVNILISSNRENLTYQIYDESLLPLKNSYSHHEWIKVYKITSDAKSKAKNVEDFIKKMKKDLDYFHSEEYRTERKSKHYIVKYNL
jgi:hypothetical protein